MLKYIWVTFFTCHTDLMPRVTVHKWGLDLKFCLSSFTPLVQGSRRLCERSRQAVPAVFSVKSISPSSFRFRFKENQAKNWKLSVKGKTQAKSFFSGTFKIKEFKIDLSPFPEKCTKKPDVHECTAYTHLRLKTLVFLGCVSKIMTNNFFVDGCGLGCPKFWGISLPNFFVYSFIMKLQWHIVLASWKLFSVAAGPRIP